MRPVRAIFWRWSAIQPAQAPRNGGAGARIKCAIFQSEHRVLKICANQRGCANVF
jgi:hypothetical protein